MSITAAQTARARGWRHAYFHRGTLPYWSIHVAAAVGVALTGWSWRGAVLVLALHVPRMLFVTAGYHRYFAHRSFKTSRWFQFVLGLGAILTGQRGPLWWAAHHRTHHKLSDEPGDLHSVKQSGFWWAHQGWILSPDLGATDLARIKDFAKYPELRWLDRWWHLPLIGFGVLTLALGGVTWFVWGFCVGQVLCWHATYTINSLAHVWGGRRYTTADDSRNNLVLAILTMGEGWHNNHHYQASARQGFFWWEIDVTYYMLRALAAIGVIWDLRGVPDHVRDRAPARLPVLPLPTETADMA
ncbi:MAG: acyl-CoA desaturase [Deltaproteobacteria bacterium]|nr:MAG: acyl-CoA desaturase [Deltaproteobacteria bacterium]